MTGKREEKGLVDSFFDKMDSIVDGAANALSGVPEPESDDDVIDAEFVDRKEPLLKSGPVGKEKKREGREVKDVEVRIKRVDFRAKVDGIGGVTILVETPTHDLVRMMLDEKEWEKLKDAIDYLE